jgi:hypothetical protein
LSDSIFLNLAKIVADVAVFCEFTDAEILDEDTAIGVMEQLSWRLSELGSEDKRAVATHLESLSYTCSDIKRIDFVRALPASLGLKDNQV